MKFLGLTLRSKLLLSFLSFTSVPVVIFSYWTLQALNSYSEQAALESLKGLVKTKAQAIEAFSMGQLNNLEKLSSLSELVSNVSSLVQDSDKKIKKIPSKQFGALEKEGGDLPQSIEEKRVKVKKDEPKKVVERKFQEDVLSKLPKKSQQARLAVKKTLSVLLADQKEFEELLIINPDGIVVASTFEGHEGKTAAGIDYFENGLKATFFQHVFISSITEKLTMVISTPIKTDTGSVLGVMAARLNLDLFFQLIREQMGLGKTGETIVAKELDGEVVFMAPTRHDFKAALSRKVKFGSNKLVSLQEAVSGQSGSGLTIDYRNVECLAAWEHIPALGWGILVKLDLDEAVNPYLIVQYKVLLITLFILFVGFVLALLVSNTMINPIKQLQEAAERISKGDMNIKLSITSKDEIGDLANSFGRMIASIKFLMEEKK